MNVALETLKLDESCGVAIRIVQSLSEQTLKILDKMMKSDLYKTSLIRDINYIEAKKGTDYKQLWL